MHAYVYSVLSECVPSELEFLFVFFFVWNVCRPSTGAESGRRVSVTSVCVALPAECVISRALDEFH